MKLLHVTFHSGTTLEVEYAFQKLGHEVTTIRFEDGETEDDQIYFIHYYRAEKFWNKYKDYIATFDGVITSDTCPISRAFLQYDYKKLLIIWICNRFDYYMFPETVDPLYYNLLRSVRERKNVFIVGNALLEAYHIASKNVDINNCVIRPIGKNFTPHDLRKNHNALTPRSNLFFVPGYYNETKYMKMSEKLTEIGIPHEQRRFEDHQELSEYKAVITLPYAWSTIAFFERIQLGMVQFIPSISFLKELCKKGGYLFQPPFERNNFELLEISEWYCDENKDLMVYFDSWTDLLAKTRITDYREMGQKILQYAERLEQQSLQGWKNILLTYKHLHRTVDDVDAPVKKELLVTYAYDTDKKIRHGDKSDGGYVIANENTRYDCYISCGISDNESFTRDFLQQHSYLKKEDCYAYDASIEDYPWKYTENITFIKKFIGPQNSDTYENLHGLIEKHNDIFLSIDIEGGEYDWLLSLSEAQMNKFAQITIELHGIGNGVDFGHTKESKDRSIEKLITHHYIVHAHGNNNGGRTSGLPNVLELTLLHKKFFDGPPPRNTVFLPIRGLDYANMRSKADIILEYPFSVPHEVLEIGTSKSRTKVIPFKTGKVKPVLHFCHNDRDEFVYMFINDELYITRTDYDGGWGQYLKAYYVPVVAAT